MKRFKSVPGQKIQFGYYIGVGQKSVFYTLRKWQVTAVRATDVHLYNLSMDLDEALQRFADLFDDVSGPNDPSIEVDREAGMKPIHRACAVMGDEKMWFGKHRNVPITSSEIETSYLCWLVTTAAKGEHTTEMSQREIDADWHAQKIVMAGGIPMKTVHIADKKWKQQICDAAEAEAIRRGAQWVAASPFKLEDHEVKLVHGAQMEKHLALSAQAEMTRQTSKHVGTVDEYADLVLTINKVVTGFGDYGEWTLWLMSDSIGNIFTKFGTISWKYVMNWAEGDWSYKVSEGHVIQVAAEVKRHEVREGVKQTQLGRMKKQASDKGFSKRWKAYDAGHEMNIRLSSWSKWWSGLISVELKPIDVAPIAIHREGKYTDSRPYIMQYKPEDVAKRKAQGEAGEVDFSVMDLRESLTIWYKEITGEDVAESQLARNLEAEALAVHQEALKSLAEEVAEYDRHTPCTYVIVKQDGTFHMVLEEEDVPHWEAKMASRPDWYKIMKASDILKK